MDEKGMDDKGMDEKGAARVVMRAPDRRPAGGRRWRAAPNGRGLTSIEGAARINL
jgi:hypothetical protein